MGKRIVFSTNSTGTIGYFRTKTEFRSLPYAHKLTQNGLKGIRICDLKICPFLT